jgi:hypothetical protein
MKYTKPRLSGSMVCAPRRDALLDGNRRELLQIHKRIDNQMNSFRKDRAVNLYNMT